MNNHRTKNLETVRRFLSCKGPERRQTRLPLFTPDGCKQMHMRINGKDILQNQPAVQWLEESANLVPEWGFYENQIFQTEDPDLFLVKSIGRGNSEFRDCPGLNVYINYYINEFRMQEGKIRCFRETVFPCARLYFAQGPGLHFQYKGDLRITLEEVRTKNRAAVMEFLTCAPEKRAEAWPRLFSQDALCDVERQTDWEAQTLTVPFQDWLLGPGAQPELSYAGLVTFWGEDPNRILAKATRPDAPYLMEFWVEDGLITRMSEAINPCDTL